MGHLILSHIVQKPPIDSCFKKKNHVLLIQIWLKRTHPIGVVSFTQTMMIIQDMFFWVFFSESLGSRKFRWATVLEYLWASHLYFDVFFASRSLSSACTMDAEFCINRIFHKIYAIHKNIKICSIQKGRLNIAYLSIVHHVATPYEFTMFSIDTPMVMCCKTYQRPSLVHTITTQVNPLRYFTKR